MIGGAWALLAIVIGCEGILDVDEDVGVEIGGDMRGVG